MKNHLPEVDAYVARSAPFARPILERLRRLFHEACPDIEETMKWRFPHFERRGIVGSMAAYKEYCSFGFWKGSIMKDPHGLFSPVGNTSMNARRITDVSQLPADRVLLSYIREAVALNKKGVKVPARKKAEPRANLEVPAFFLAALHKNKKAKAAFESLSPSHQREYTEWLTEAKQQATRDKRLATAIEWLAEGKPRYWKYHKK